MLDRFLAVMALLAIALFSVSAATCSDDRATGEFTRQYAADKRAFDIARDGLAQTVAFGQERPALFNRDASRDNGLMPRPDKMAIWGTWSGFLNCQAALDAVRHRYGRFGQLADKSQKETSFILSRAAFLAGYRYALEFIALTDGNPDLDTILNEAVPELGIPSDTFARIKFRFLNVAAATEFGALEVIGKQYDDGDPALVDAIEADRAVIWKMGKGEGHALTLKNALTVVQRAGQSAWFPVQKGISEWMGDTKVLRKDMHLISEDQVSAMGRQLAPGDILFERHEWYLSNLGLPGFWTHVALYVGTPEERRRFFNSPQVQAWVKEKGEATGDLENLLAKRYPEAYRICTSQTTEGTERRILEAISEGVSFTSLEFTGASDSIGVIRPRLSMPQKAQAIMRAFHFSGRPYDFNFDFTTDAALVCSELIHKAYAPGPGMQGMRFPLIEVLGRPVGPPNEMVRQFCMQQASDAPQSDFVLFLDGFEKEQMAVDSTAEAFCQSWQRPNWHILIQDAPVERTAADASGRP